MRRFVFALTLVLVAISSRSAERLSIRDIVFLTRDGCVNTAQMRTELDAALRTLTLPTSYVVVDIDKLTLTDSKRGYGTPTVLYKGRDLFGMPAPRQAASPA